MKNSSAQAEEFLDMQELSLPSLVPREGYSFFTPSLKKRE
jgi:hypothetical protein